VTTLGFVLALAAFARISAGQAVQDVPTPMEVPVGLRPPIAAELQSLRKDVMDARGVLVKAITQQTAFCKAVDSEDTGRIKKCNDWSAQLGVQYKEYDTQRKRFDAHARLERAMQRELVALRGLQSGLAAFQSELKAAGWKGIADEATAGLALIASLAEPTKIVTKAIFLAETAKVFQWVTTVLFNKANGCAFPDENLQATCKNLEPLAATLERTRREVKNALIEYDPQIRLLPEPAQVLPLAPIQ
jgi:hypothetical protein